MGPPDLGGSLSSRSWTLRQDLELYQRLDIHRVSLFLPKLIEAGLQEAIAKIVGRELQVDCVLPGAAFDLTDQSGWAKVEEADGHGRRDRRTVWEGTVPTAGGSGEVKPTSGLPNSSPGPSSPSWPPPDATASGIALEPTRPQFAHVGFVHTLRDAAGLRPPIWTSG